MPTREEIVKALRCDCTDCACCLYCDDEGHCRSDYLYSDVADLIVRQAEEIERLKRERDAAIKDLAIANECGISEAFRWRRVGGRR